MAFTEHDALALAIKTARKSPCAKTKRGVVVFHRDGYESIGWNHPPLGFACDGSPECRAACGQVCVHAEMDALLGLTLQGQTLEMLHVKVVDGKAVPSSYPSCWQCSRLILEARITTMWLLHEDGLHPYSAAEFHELTLRSWGLPVIKA
jgi:deoxycytidylate deaminase